MVAAGHDPLLPFIFTFQEFKLKKGLIIGGIAAGVIILLIAAFMTFNAVRSEDRQNILKIIEANYNDGLYDRALDNVEDLLKRNINDRDALSWRKKILEAKNSKEKFAQTEEEERQKKENQMLFDSMNSMIDKTEKKPVIIRQEDNNGGAQENEKTKKINKLIDEGIQAYNNQNYAMAKSKFFDALQMDGNNAESNAYLGMTLYDDNPDDSGNVEEAIKHLKKALSTNNNLENAHFALARIYDHSDIKDSAIEEYKETIKLNPRNYEAFYALGKLYYEQKNYKNADSNFSAAVKIKPDFVNALYYLANTKRRLDNHNDAIKYYKQIISIDPKFHYAYSGLGEIYRFKNDYATALNYYKAAAEINNNYNYYQKMGECYKALNQSDKGIESYLKAISLNPKSNDKDRTNLVEAYEAMAEIEKNRGNYENAIKYVNDGLAVSQTSVLYYISAFSKSKLGNIDDAVNDYNKAININPKDMESYVNLSKLYNEAGKYENSITVAQKGLSIDSSQFRLYNNMADSLQKLKNFDLAVTAYQKSIDLNPSNPVIHFNLGICLKETKNFDDAIKSFQKAISIDSSYYDAYYELGSLYFSLDKYDEAKSVFKILINGKPDYPKRDQIDKMMTAMQ